MSQTCYHVPWYWYLNDQTGLVSASVGYFSLFPCQSVFFHVRVNFAERHRRTINYSNTAHRQA